MESVLTIIALAAIPAAVVGALYAINLYWKNGAISRVLLGLLTFYAVISALAGLYFDWIAAIRLECGVTCVPLWTQWITWGMGIVLSTAPLIGAFALWRLRRR